MMIGIPKEMKKDEYRVGAVPALVHLLHQSGHTVLVQRGAGARIGFTDDQYVAKGANIVSTIEEVYQAELILKVKEPERAEFPLLRRRQILFCFLHLVSHPEVLSHLIERKVIAIAYETVKDHAGNLPLLSPMSEIAGKLAILAGARALEVSVGGKGILLGRLPGVSPAKVAIIGGGVVGREAANVALAIGAETSILDINQERLHSLDAHFGHRLRTLFATQTTLEEEVKTADLVVGALLVAGRKTPKVLTEAMIQSMAPGSAFVDVSIDQGGCSETSRLSNFSDPYYIAHGVVHYAVPNMPSAVARTSSCALSNALTDYLLRLADKGTAALLEDQGFLEGVNVLLGHVTSKAMAEEMDYPHFDPIPLLEETLSSKHL